MIRSLRTFSDPNTKRTLSLPVENYGHEGYQRIYLKSKKEAALSSWHAVTLENKPLKSGLRSRPKTERTRTPSANRAAVGSGPNGPLLHTGLRAD